MRQLTLVQLEESVTHSGEDDFAVQHKAVPQTEGEREGDSVQKALKEPLEGVESRVNVELLEVLEDAGQETFENLVVMPGKAGQLREAGNKESVHCITVVRHEAVHGPEHILLVVQVHHQQSCQLRHALAVTDLLSKRNVSGFIVFLFDEKQTILTEL